MIKKSRLEELIKQGATIYDKYRAYSLKNEEYTSSDFWYKRTAEIKDNKLHYTYEDSDYYENFDRWLELEQLFETEKDAKWALKYQRIPRTEYLDLPTFEDFGKHPYLSFHDEIPDLYELKIDKNANIVLTLYRGGIYDCGIIKFSKEFTEENYTEVCDLCVELFKGE